MAFAVLSPVARWYWKDETGVWKAYEDGISDAIEGAYASNQPFVVLGNKYRVNVPARQQINLATNFSRAILRGTWFWQDNPGTYIPYNEGVAARLESAFLSNQFDIPIPVDSERHVVLKPDMVSSRQLRNAAPRGSVLTARVVCRGYLNQLCQAQSIVQQTVVQQAQPTVQTVIHQAQPAMQTVIRQQSQPAVQTVIQSQPAMQTVVQPVMQPMMGQPQQTVVQQTQLDPGMQGGLYPQMMAQQPQPQQLYPQMMTQQPQILPQQTSLPSIPQQQFLQQQQLQPQQQMFQQQLQTQQMFPQQLDPQQQMFQQQQLQPQQQMLPQQQQMFPQQQQLQPQQQQMFPQQQQLDPQQQQMYSQQQQQMFPQQQQYAPLSTTQPQAYPMATNQCPPGYPPNYQ